MAPPSDGSERDEAEPQGKKGSREEVIFFSVESLENE